jgi:hypothetical protein
MKEDVIFEIYKDYRTVFRISDVALLLENDDALLYQKLNNLVRKGQLLNIRKGIYAKENYKPEELACLLYTATYISLNYVLQKNGVVFQFDSAITNVSYLSREIIVDNQTILYRQIKKEILLNTAGIINQGNINMATPERAFLDTLYLNGFFYFDNLKALNVDEIFKILPVYKSKRLTKYVTETVKKNG